MFYIEQCVRANLVNIFLSAFEWKAAHVHPEASRAFVVRAGPSTTHP